MNIEKLKRPYKKGKVCGRILSHTMMGVLSGNRFTEEIWKDPPQRIYHRTVAFDSTMRVRVFTGIHPQHNEFVYEHIGFELIHRHRNCDYAGIIPIVRIELEGEMYDILFNLIMEIKRIENDIPSIPRCPICGNITHAWNMFGATPENRKCVGDVFHPNQDGKKP